jgi:hypothetical protein
MTSHRLVTYSDKCIGTLFDIMFLSPFSYITINSFTEQKPTSGTDLFLSQPTLQPEFTAYLSLFFGILAYGLFFHYVLKQTPGHYLRNVFRRKEFSFCFSQIQIPKSLALASATLILIFSSLIYVSGNSDQTSRLARCSATDENLNSWSSIETTRPSRIAISLALYQAEIITQECLRAESLRAVSEKENLSEAYLGLAWTDGAKKENVTSTDFETICADDLNHEACQTDFNLKIKRSFASTEPIKVQSDYIKILKFKQLEKNHQYEPALRILNESSYPFALAPFISRKRFEMLWHLGQKEVARSIYQATFAFLTSKDRLNFAQSMCQLELGLTCEDKSAKACQDYISAYQSAGSPEDSRPSYERALSCL